MKVVGVSQMKGCVTGSGRGPKKFRAAIAPPIFFWKPLSSKSGYAPVQIILLYWKRKGIRIERNMKGLAGGNTKKRGNKKSGESKTLIRYNVMNMYS